ncbi:MAG TPA: nitroreductase/quinone reductase family protein [Gemmatimonadaceae bacterium]|nr:nitroreductase/quinone reductase family protein [Gemmatimonadaceae bacterium]
MKSFARSTIRALDDARILGVRSGDAHRYTGVWVVVVEDRVFVRSWNDKPTGWYRAFRDEPRGSFQLDGREIAVTARHVRSARLRDAVTAAYAAKYHTKASQRWTRGFAKPERALATLEFVPR